MAVNDGIYDDTHRVGGMSKDTFMRDPKRLAFVLARYKETAHLLAEMECESVLEVGCADGWASRIVRQRVKDYHGIDVDPMAIDEARDNVTPRWPMTFDLGDISLNGQGVAFKKDAFDGVFALDVLEHIARGQDEYDFLSGMARVAPIAVIGTPTLESQEHASELSRAGHINCKTALNLKLALRLHWSRVVLWGMNDAVLHSGFPAMRHYHLALCIR